MLSGHPEGAPDPVGDPAGHDMGVIDATMTSFKLPFGTVYTAKPDVRQGHPAWGPGRKTCSSGRSGPGGTWAATADRILPPMPLAERRAAE
jgi:hypothetical protein